MGAVASVSKSAKSHKSQHSSKSVQTIKSTRTSTRKSTKDYTPTGSEDTQSSELGINIFKHPEPAVEAVLYQIDPSHVWKLFESVLKMAQILDESEGARIQFTKFFEERKWIEDLTEDNSKFASIDVTQEDHSGILVADYCMSPRTRRVSYEESTDHFMSRIHLVQQLKVNDAKFVGDEFTFEDVDESSFTDDQMRWILFASLCPLFVDACSHADNAAHRKSSLELPVIHEDTADNIPVPNLHLVGFSKFSARVEAKVKEGKERIRDMYLATANSWPAHDMNLAVDNGSWVQNFLNTMENLPLSISIATAKEDMPGFPLVYVNKAFEKMTQWDRTEVLGKSCRFLQSHKTERDLVARVSRALGNAMASKVAICNVRKDGSEFFNMLALHPVFDHLGIYSYVIGIQYDITRADATTKEIKLVEDLIVILTNLLRC